MRAVIGNLDSGLRESREEGRSMVLKGFTRQFKPLAVLTEEQIEEIHQETLRVLWTTGVRIEHERALKLCEETGCR